MKLYKILRMFGDHGVSVFPPETQQLPDSPELAGEPWSENFRILRQLGFTDEEAGRALMAWAYHAKYTLKQGEAGIRLFVRNCVVETAQYKTPTEPVTWTIIIVVAGIVAVALGLYAWAVLDQDINVVFGTHPWAYLMSYNENLYVAEILNVGSRQEGMYEEGGLFGDAMESIRREWRGARREDLISVKPGYIVLQGRRIVFYHVYRIKAFEGYFCGVATRVGNRLYKLRKGGRDPYKPQGIWSRPGGRMYTDEYDGAWKSDFWWL